MSSSNTSGHIVWSLLRSQDPWATVYIMRSCLMDTNVAIWFTATSASTTLSNLSTPQSSPKSSSKSLIWCWVNALSLSGRKPLNARVRLSQTSSILLAAWCRPILASHPWWRPEERNPAELIKKRSRKRAKRIPHRSKRQSVYLRISRTQSRSWL